MILVTGHPRSGTGYMAAVYRERGYDVGHEVLGADGVSSWQLASDEPQRWGQVGLTRAAIAPSEVVHVVREPLRCISSTLYTEQGTMGFRARNAGIPPCSTVEHAVLSWVLWNRYVERLDPDETVRVEDVDAAVRKDVNARRHPMLTWRVIRQSCSRATIAALVDAGERYGYEVPL